MFLANISDLNFLWYQFKTEDESVLDCLIALHSYSDYLFALLAEVCALINTCIRNIRLISSIISH